MDTQQVVLMRLSYCMCGVSCISWICESFFILLPLKHIVNTVNYPMHYLMRLCLRGKIIFLTKNMYLDKNRIFF